VGYRWFDHENIAPLFAFGHGLSYTTFAYSALEIERATDGGLDVSVMIKNTGDVDGDEVPRSILAVRARPLRVCNFRCAVSPRSSAFTCGPGGRRS